MKIKGGPIFITLLWIIIHLFIPWSRIFSDFKFDAKHIFIVCLMYVVVNIAALVIIRLLESRVPTLSIENDYYIALVGPHFSIPFVLAAYVFPLLFKQLKALFNWLDKNIIINL